jgi:hypothetical protein
MSNKLMKLTGRNNKSQDVTVYGPASTNDSINKFAAELSKDISLPQDVVYKVLNAIAERDKRGSIHFI